jgi:hypothetical protein
VGGEDRVVHDEAKIRERGSQREPTVAAHQADEDPDGRNGEPDPPPVRSIRIRREGPRCEREERRIDSCRPRQRDGEIDDRKHSGQQRESVPERAVRLCAQSLPHPGHDERDRFASGSQRRSAGREQRRVDDLVAAAGPMAAGERPTSDGEQPAHQLAAPSARASTTWAARRRRPASAASAA